MRDKKSCTWTRNIVERDLYIYVYPLYALRSISLLKR